MRAKYLLAIALAGTFSLATTFADQIGDKAKPLTVSEWVKGAKNVDVTDGKNIYVVEFWATWCPPCKASIPHLTELQKAYKDKGVVFVGVSTEKLETVEPFVKELGEKMDYTVAVDKDRATSKDYMTAYGQNGIPCAFIINKEGQIAWVGHPMSMEESLEQIQTGKYDLAAAIAADRVRAKIDEYSKLVKAKDPKAAELGAELLKDVAGDEKSIEKLYEAVSESEDTEMIEKVLNVLAKVNPESAKQYRMQAALDEAYTGYLQAIGGEDKDKKKAAADKLVATFKEAKVDTILNVALQLSFNLEEKADATLIQQLLDAAAAKDETPQIPVDFYRGVISYKIGSIEKGDEFVKKGLEAMKDEGMRKSLEAFAARAKDEAQKAKEPSAKDEPAKEKTE